MKELKKHFIFLCFLSIGLSLYTALFGHMNNWLIFRASFFHLIDGSSLYQHYPQEHNDLFKYSPTFALLIAPLSLLPAWLGAVLWNLLGAILFILALRQLPLSLSHKKGIYWISLPEFIGSTQGFQSNIHVVSLLVLYWCALEKKNFLYSSFFLLQSFFIKLFGLIGASLFLFNYYSETLKDILKNTLSLIGLFLCFSLLPVIVVGWESLIFQYQEWILLLKNDAAQSYGFSLMGVVHGLTGMNFNRLPVQMLGGVSLLLAFFFHRKGDQATRLLGLVALCYFVVLFNHKSESPTFIIAMFAFGIHQGFIQSQRLRWVTIILTLSCVSLMYSDLFKHIKQSHLDVYCVKAWPFIILFPLVLFQMNKSHTKIELRRKSLNQLL